MKSRLKTREHNDILTPKRRQTMNDIKEKIVELIKRAEEGSCYAQYDLGVHFAFEDQDMAEAVKWWRMAAEQGYEEAKFALGECYATGEGVEKNIDEAIRLWTDSLDSRAMLFFLRKCRQCKANPEKANFELAKWIRKLAKQGNADAQYYYGECICQYGIPRNDGHFMLNFKRAIKWWLKAAKQGHPGAMDWLVTCYHRGLDVPRSDEKSAKWLLKLASNKSLGYEHDMGWYYAWGRGVPRDYSKAVSWWLKAAKKGYSEAEYDLGESYAKGAGVKEDKEESIKWFRKAAEHGNEIAQYMLDRINNEGFESVQRELKVYLQLNDPKGKRQ